MIGGIYEAFSAAFVRRRAKVAVVTFAAGKLVVRRAEQSLPLRKMNNGFAIYLFEN
jgi:hypothetical protein